MQQRILGLAPNEATSVAASHRLPIGSLTSQHLANFHLGFLDRFVKERLRVRDHLGTIRDRANRTPPPTTSSASTDTLVSGQNVSRNSLRLKVRGIDDVERLDALLLAVLDAESVDDLNSANEAILAGA